LIFQLFSAGTTLQDLTEAALEEIERQEAAMENLDGTETIAAGSVIHEISAGIFSLRNCLIVHGVT
jgi:hypothetical protein